jgi:hypothetical protein
LHLYRLLFWAVRIDSLPTRAIRTILCWSSGKFGRLHFADVQALRLKEIIWQRNRYHSLRQPETQWVYVGGPRYNGFNGKIQWVQIDIDAVAKDADHMIGAEERFNLAIARQ